MKKTAAKGKLPPHVALIILIPVILVLLLLNTGWLQGMVPAVTVYGQSYSALEFRYYFYDAYYDYVNEHAEHLAELGLDVSKALKDQSFDGEQTWQDHFKAEALAALEEDTLLLEAAEEAGYTAQEEVQAACDARLEELRQYCVDTGLKSLGDYFTSYYDTGMTQDLYLELYSGQILAESYRKALEEELGPSEADVEDYVAALGTAADYTADLSLAYFEAEADRVSGQPEQRQWDNAQTLGEAFLDRWAQVGGGTERFCAMAVAYTRAEEVPQDGVWTDMAADDLEDEVAQWCFQGQPAVGETALLQGEKGWWAVCYLGQGEDARAIQARQDLWQARYDQWRAQRQADRTTATHALGMAIAL